MVADVKRAIAQDIQPELIFLRSSGSYFVFDLFQTKIGVFKLHQDELYVPISSKLKNGLIRIYYYVCLVDHI